ncbi:MAG: transcription-repair coupling factor [Verrucomicrobia bacterium]|nr:transcription-repair coupling factor [Verrucomicrobiota bacterium]MBU4290516.1 transcription-repair coupling factor [Verrucomicrobiota bacterium]MBU4430357.1 transcription-repair coupling factor [Verrucomicrobiota bacterium]MBU4497114.1 transcription-repair coupling factor [Verrucomicrobiota bacterium]MCG2681326.1 transcription-repair coupling factor [Kiritimatiellia bacterium]
MITIHISGELRQSLAEVFATRHCCRLPPLSWSATAFFAWEMHRAFERTVVLVTDSLKTQDDLHRNLTAFAGTRESRLLYFPAREAPASQKGGAQPDIMGDRFHTLDRLNGVHDPLLVVTCVQALMQAMPEPDTLRAHILHLALQEEHDPQALMIRLEEMGYEPMPEVQGKGQAAQRGGLLDVWPPTDPFPSRIEFFGSTIDTIRSFDPANQRSITRQSALIISPADEWRLMKHGRSAPSLLTDYLPADVIYFWAEAISLSDVPASESANSSIESHAAAYEQAMTEPPDRGLTIPFRDVHRRMTSNSTAWQCISGWETVRTGPDDWREAPMLDPGFRSVAEVAEPPRRLFEPDVYETRRRQWLARLEERTRHGMTIYFFFHTQGALDRFRETHPETPFHLCRGTLSDGFMHEAMGLAVIAESNFMGFQKLMPGRYDPQTRRRKERRPTTGLPARNAPAEAGETITEWLSIEPGDLVVHVDHGIGKYLGLYEIEFPSDARRAYSAEVASATKAGSGLSNFPSPAIAGYAKAGGGNGKLQEALAIEYAEKARLYVPVSQTHLLSRYIGVGKHHASVHKLGGKRWFREKAAAEKAVRDLAASLLETQARRESMPGFAYPPDTPWQHEFEAAFPYQETDDQDQAIREIKHDLESTLPMDRLVCGDVGYGKTEVAMRAAFKTVMAGKQVAILVPTTVLAQQHYEVFNERMSAYPIRVELLCRFRTHGEQSTAVRGLRAGAVDIVIGTHRLLQPDVQFKDLGLVVIDEEQRFGVEHKERLKQVKQLVDVLTLTATPIPRTLYMSLTGARDISMIQTPPKARLAIETQVVKNDDLVVREAIRRELNRGGQVYYLHNRVMTIDKIRERLQRLAPEARLGIAHGQMPTGELARIMRAFSRGELDVLLCTTIIESGVDIPNVNTILIDRADRFGMADLYQLRGRVGRSTRKAYAYLLLPGHGRLLDTPRQRIHAIMEHADLGAGFRLAMRDLEIRGAGNMLGTEQSGHIAAIGFDLYCQLLRRTIAQSSGKSGQPEGPPTAGPASEPTRDQVVKVDVSLDFIDLSAHAADIDCSAFLPGAYVEDERLRISIYRKIASAVTEQEINNLREEFHDRFGPLPGPLNRLLKIAVLRILAAAKRVTGIESREGKIMVKRDGDYLMLKHQFPRLKSSAADARLDEIRDWLSRLTNTGFAEKT